MDRAMAVVDVANQILTESEKTDFVQKIERGIQSFADNIPWLMKSLDEVAKIHPVVTGMCLYLQRAGNLLNSDTSCRVGFQGCLLPREYAKGE